MRSSLSIQIVQPVYNDELGAMISRILSNMENKSNCKMIWVDEHTLSMLTMQSH